MTVHIFDSAESTTPGTLVTLCEKELPADQKIEDPHQAPMCGVCTSRLTHRANDMRRDRGLPE